MIKVFRVRPRPSVCVVVSECERGCLSVRVCLGVSFSDCICVCFLTVSMSLDVVQLMNGTDTPFFIRITTLRPMNDNVSFNYIWYHPPPRDEGGTSPKISCPRVETSLLKFCPRVRTSLLKFCPRVRPSPRNLCPTLIPPGISHGCKFPTYPETCTRIFIRNNTLTRLKMHEHFKNKLKTIQASKIMARYSLFLLRTIYSKNKIKNIREILRTQSLNRY